jgi:hypothetical protein
VPRWLFIRGTHLNPEDSCSISQRGSADTKVGWARSGSRSERNSADSIGEKESLIADASRDRLKIEGQGSDVEKIADRRIGDELSEAIRGRRALFCLNVKWRSGALYLLHRLQIVVQTQQLPKLIPNNLSASQTLS